MAAYRRCPECGASLDAGERCDCEETQMNAPPGRHILRRGLENIDSLPRRQLQEAQQRARLARYWEEYNHA